MKTRNILLFPLGQVVITNSLLSEFDGEIDKAFGEYGWLSKEAFDGPKEQFLAGAIANLLDRHSSRDWGDVGLEDALANDYAIEHGERVLSSYVMFGLNVWIITEWDRSITTVLAPSDY
jgi:hypothetical protein